MFVGLIVCGRLELDKRPCNRARGIGEVVDEIGPPSPQAQNPRVPPLESRSVSPVLWSAASSVLLASAPKWTAELQGSASAPSVRRRKCCRFMGSSPEQAGRCTARKRLNTYNFGRHADFEACRVYCDRRMFDWSRVRRGEGPVQPRHTADLFGKLLCLPRPGRSQTDDGVASRRRGRREGSAQRQPDRSRAWRPQRQRTLRASLDWRHGPAHAASGRRPRSAAESRYRTHPLMDRTGRGVARPTGRSSHHNAPKCPRTAIQAGPPTRSTASCCGSCGPNGWNPPHQHRGNHSCGG